MLTETTNKHKNRSSIATKAQALGLADSFPISTSLFLKELLPQVANSTAAKIERGTALKDNVIQPKADNTLVEILNAYFSPKPFEKDGVIYKALGVPHFKQSLMKTIGKYFQSKKTTLEQGNGYCLDGHLKKDLQVSEQWTRLYESIHVGAIVLTNLPVAISSLINWESPTAFKATIIASAFILNAYCIMLQRFNRGRLLKVIDKINKYQY
jgi:hypothetical protein